MKKFINMITILSLCAASFCSIHISAAASGWSTEGTAVVTGDTAELNGEARASRVYSELENGTYNLTVSVTNSDISGTAYVYAKTEGHTAVLTAIPQYTTEQKITVPGIIVDNGSCEVGVYVNGAASVTAGGFTLSPCEETRVPFLKGGEISKLTYVEDNGGRFYRADGTEGDALQIMAENGFNLARIRVLCDPGKGHGNGTYYLPEGYMTEEDCLSLARRAKSKGMQIEWTFAYSDWWVDGGEQYPPHEWLEGAEGKTGSALASYYADKIYEYTKQVLKDLKAQDTEPEYVSIGNEMQLGMCFGAWQSNNGLYNNSTYIAQLANAGARAVREECPDAKIILHTDNGGKVLTGRKTFVNALKNIDFDVIGVSYYPYYNADVSIDTVVSEFATMINTYNKDVIIMETGYNWNDVRGDGWEGQLKDSGYYQNIYGESRNGQRAFLTELYAKLKQVAGGRCIGDLYWDPVMLYDGGTYTIGWAIKEDGDWTDGNVVSNSTIFDFDGWAVEGQQAMKYNTNSTDKLLITGKTSALNAEITVNVNGTEYKTTSDKFGDYIAAVPYPADGKLFILAEGYSEAYDTDAPSEGVLLNGIDFKTSGTAPTPKPTENPTPEPEFTVTAAPDGSCTLSGIPEAADTVYLASYDENGILISVKEYQWNGDNFFSDKDVKIIKAFAWSGMEPKARAASAEIR